MEGSPHTEMVPELWSAAKAEWVEAMVTKPPPLGAPLPPKVGSPHAEMAPEPSSATKVLSFTCCPFTCKGCESTSRAARQTTQSKLVRETPAGPAPARAL